MAKNILFIHTKFLSGGAEKVTLDISNYVKEQGYKTHIIANSFMGIEHLDLITHKIPENCGDIKSLKTAEYIIEIINKYSIDIFIIPVEILPFLDLIKKQTTAKIVFIQHSVPFWEYQFEIYYKEKRSHKNLWKRAGWYLFNCPKLFVLKTKLKALIYKYKTVYDLCDAYITLCNGYRDLLIEKLELNINEKKIKVIHNSQAPIQIDKSNLNKKKQLLFVGRLSYEDKRVDRLIDIWNKLYKKYPDWELIIVGDGPEKSEITNKITRNHIERIRLEGYRTNVKQYYKDASILCLTSNFEGWPLCLIEAQTYGVVPIAFDCVAGINEIISPSWSNGILIKPFSIKSYVSALEKVMSDSNLLEQMRINVINKKNIYSPDLIKEKWIELFNSLNN